MRILLVEDSIVLLSALRKRLEERGNTVDIAVNGLEGYKKAFEFIPEVVVTDIVMPTMNGYHLCRLLKNSEFFKNVPIILLTALDQSMDKFWAYQSGADLFLNKSDDMERLADEIIEFAKAFKANLPPVVGNGTLDHGTVFNELADLFDSVLLKLSLKNSILSLVNYVNDPDYLFKELMKFISSISEVVAMRVIMASVDCGIIVFSSDVYSFGSKDRHISDYMNLLRRPLIPPEWEVNVIEEGTIPVDEFKGTKTHLSISTEGNVVGEITLYHKVGYDLSNREAEVFEELKTSFGRISDILFNFKRYKNQSIQDGLTGLYNYRFLIQKISELLNSGQSASLIMMDIDDFKLVNGAFGHNLGNEVLMEIARILKRNTRPNDVVSRFGGEEFAILLPGIPLPKAGQVAERIRRSVERNPWQELNEELRVTISLGVATNFGKKLTSTELIELADKKLYLSKRAGKNKVVC